MSKVHKRQQLTSCLEVDRANTSAVLSRFQATKTGYKNALKRKLHNTLTLEYIKILLVFFTNFH